MACTPKPARRAMKKWRRTGVKWAQVSFSYSGWIECVCGFRPYSQKDMNNHSH